MTATHRIRFGYVDAPDGQVHYAEQGEGSPVLCLHQTPRSWDEYREVMGELSADYRVIAMDTPGMGGTPPRQSGSIETYAQAASDLLTGLQIERVAVIGHHTGGVIAVRLAAIAGKRISRLVLSSTPFVDAPGREMRQHRPPIDSVNSSADGKHLQVQWNRRAAFYPSDRPDLQQRYLLDALRATNPEEGHEAVAQYAMEQDIHHVTQPCLLVGHARDPHAFPELEPLHRQLPHAKTAVLAAGMVPLEYTARAFVSAVRTFLAQT
jgi:pimeloyl-ACP methyl ester carboxylesterase